MHPGAGLYDATGLSGPAVGDWVALRGELAVAVLPRTSAFVRTVAGRTSAAQVVAANLDTVLVVDALVGRGPAAAGRALPRGRLGQRGDAGRRPHQGRPVRRRRRRRSSRSREDALGVEVLPVSSVTGEGLDAVRALLPPGPHRRRWSARPASGKSSLVNALAGRPVAGDRRDPESDGRGRHTTTARELHLLPGGGLLIDTPGMRELGAATTTPTGVDTAYADVALAGRRLPVPRLRAPHRARLRGRRRHRRRPARPRPATPRGASCRPRRTASCCASTPAPGPRRRRGCGPSTGRSGTSRNRPR